MPKADEVVVPAVRGRGRPTVVDAEQIAEAALRLWLDRGYQDTGWQDIAAVTGVSTRTLMRRFGSRSNIPWVGVGAAADRLAASLAASTGLPTGVALRRAIVDSITHSAQVRRAGPDWLALVSGEPDLLLAAPRAYAPWTGAIADFIASRNPGAPSAICHALATAYQAAAFTALAEWVAAGSVGEPDEAVDHMLRWLDVHAPVTDDGESPPTKDAE